MTLPLEGTTGSPAAGTLALLGLLADQQLSSRQVGAPSAILVAPSPIAQPTVATNLTGITATAAQYVIQALYGGKDGSAHGPASQASDPINLANQGSRTTLVPDTDAYAHRLFRKINDAGTEDDSLVTGLNDLTWSGATYTGAQRARFEVKITTKGTPDKFRWRKVLLDQATGLDQSIGAWSGEVSITGSAQTLSDDVTITFGATTGHDADAVWKDTYRCDFLHITTKWDATSLTIDDTTPSGSEDLAIPYDPADSRASNYGLYFQRMNPGTDLKATFPPIVPAELTGGSTPPRALPGLGAFDHALDMALRTGSLIPILASMHGIPTVTQTPGKPEFLYDFPGEPYTQPSDSLSLSGLLYKGGGVPPEWFWSGKAGEIDIDFSEGKEATIKTKIVGTGYAVCSIGHIVSGTDTNGGTYTGSCALRGVPGFATAFSETVRIKITDAPSGGTFKFVTQVGTAGWSTYKSTGYYDTTSGRMVKGGVNPSPWVKLLDSGGYSLGIDLGENRKPLTIFFAGDVRGLAVDDTRSFLPTQPYPGIYSAQHPTGPSDDGSYLGQALRTILDMRFMSTHVTLLRGVGSADTFLSATSAGIKYMRPLTPYRELGEEGGIGPVDVDVFGKATVQLTIARRLISQEFQRMLFTNARYVGAIQISGAPIRTNPGVLGAPELIEMGLTQLRCVSTASPVGTEKVLPENVVFEAEKPDGALAGQPFFNPLRVRSAQFFDYSQIV